MTVPDRASAACDHEVMEPAAFMPKEERPVTNSFPTRRRVLAVPWALGALILLSGVPVGNGTDVSRSVASGGAIVGGKPTEKGASTGTTYTRQRRRALEHESYYVHVDVSDEFSAFGKWSVFAVFASFWLFDLFPHWFLSVDHRPAVALCGGVAMISLRSGLAYVGQGPRFDVRRNVVIEPLLLLFGASLISSLLLKTEPRGGIADGLRRAVDGPAGGGRVRCAKIAAASAVLSALLTNDAVGTMLSGAVLDMCDWRASMSLAMFANAGAALTYTGSLHNLLIVSVAYDEIGWLEFVANMALPVVAVVFIYAMFIFVLYCIPLSSGRRVLHGSSNGAGGVPGSKNHAYEGIPRAMKEEEGGMTGRRREGPGEDGDSSTPAWSWNATILVSNLFLSLILCGSGAYVGAATVCAVAALQLIPLSFGCSVWTKLQVLVLALTVVSFAAGSNVCAASIGAGAALLLIASCRRRRRRRRHRPEGGNARAEENDGGGEGLVGIHLEPPLEEADDDEPIDSRTALSNVDYGRIVYLIGQFVSVGSLNDTGLPQALFNTTLGRCADMATEGACVYRFATVVAVLTNVASSTTTCLMVAATFPYASPYVWSQVAFSSTVSGNLTKLCCSRSASREVEEEASEEGNSSSSQSADDDDELCGTSFFDAAKARAAFGVLSTLLCLYVGTFILSYNHVSPECSVKLGECDEWN